MGWRGRPEQQILRTMGEIFENALVIRNSRVPLSGSELKKPRTRLPVIQVDDRLPMQTVVKVVDSKTIRRKSILTDSVERSWMVTMFSLRYYQGPAKLCFFHREDANPA